MTVNSSTFRSWWLWVTGSTGKRAECLWDFRHFLAKDKRFSLLILVISSSWTDREVYWLKYPLKIRFLSQNRKLYVAGNVLCSETFCAVKRFVQWNVLCSETFWDKPFSKATFSKATFSKETFSKETFSKEHSVKQHSVKNHSVKKHSVKKHSATNHSPKKH